jgi:cholesterol transport system auxiliary component
MRLPKAPLAIATAALILGGCVRFGAEPPRQLLGLSAADSIAAGRDMTAPTGRALTVLDPVTPRAFDNLRVAVRTGPTGYAYVKKAQWTDTPRHMFRRLLGETIAARTGRLVVDPAQFTTDPGSRLMGEIVDFSIDAQARRATVTFDASLIAADGSTVSKQRFTASAPVSKIDPATVATPLNSAANDVARQVADWIAQRG